MSLSGSAIDLHAPIEALIFDMDGLLVDSEPLAEQAMVDFLRRYGHERRAEVMAKLLGRRLPEAIAIVSEAYELPGPIKALVQEYDALRLDALRGQIQPMPGAREILAFAKLAELKLALATSGQRSHADVSLAETGLAGSFEAEVTGNDVERGKPAPDLFLLAAARIGVEPARCIVLEDAPPGIAAAAAAGMRSICVPNEKSKLIPFPVEPTVTVSDLLAAIPWLQSHGVVTRKQDERNEPASLPVLER
ncbi:MAG: HAD family hydrolase [Thermomicrobiales bacterium]